MLSKMLVLVLVPFSFLGCSQPFVGTCSNGFFEDDLEPCFTFDTSFNAGVDLPSMAAGDLDGDGAFDLVVVSRQTDDVGILLSSFLKTPVFIPVGDHPNAVVTGDFNNDGLLDVATGNADSSISMLLNQGSDASPFLFDAAINLPVGFLSTSLIAEDFNGDGLLDLAGVDQLSISLNILLGNGEGSFGAPNRFSLDERPTAPTAGDFNHDGFLDIAIVDSVVDTLSVLLGDGKGSFGAPERFAVKGENPKAMATADINNDGVLDLVVANGFVTDDSSGDLTIFLGNEFGAIFSTPTSIPLDKNDASSLVIEDLNQDGFLDIAVANESLGVGEEAGNVSLLLGRGSGWFEDPINFDVGDGPSSIVAEDFNGDGFLDLATANAFSNTVSVLLSNP